MKPEEAQHRMRKYALYLAYHRSDRLTAKHVPHSTARRDVLHYLRQHSMDYDPRGMGNKWHWRIGELPNRLQSKADRFMQSLTSRKA